MSFWVQSGCRTLKNYAKNFSIWEMISSNVQVELRLPFIGAHARNFGAYSKHCQKNTTETTPLVRTERTVPPYGYLELRNVDLDVFIKPACPNQYPDMNRAIYSFYSTAGSTSPQLIQTNEKLSLKTDIPYSPKENYCCFEIPIKYGMNSPNVFSFMDQNIKIFLFSDIDSANIEGQNSVQVESFESGSIRVSTGSGNITTKSIKGDFISLLSQSGHVTCTGISQGRITIQSGSGVCLL